MARAIELASRGWGRTYPNPLVGALVVAAGVEIGAGYHAAFGEAHAEPVALAAAGARSRGATLYVTLEPCTHVGKQPPCVDAILAAGVARVVIATLDPDPVASGGAAALRARGVVVDVGVGAAEATRQNFRFLRRFTSPARPFVAVKLAVSLDGMIADADGHSRWVSGAPARGWAHWLRAGFAAVGIGARSAIADGARLTVRGELKPRVPPQRVVFDRRGLLPATHPLFDEADAAPVVVVVGAKHAATARQALGNTPARIVVADDVAISMRLLAEAGIDSIVVEGGGRLAGAMLNADLVDRVYQVQCPVWLGDGVPAWAGLGAPGIDSARRWRMVDSRLLGDPGDVMLQLEP